MDEIKFYEYIKKKLSAIKTRKKNRQEGVAITITKENQFQPATSPSEMYNVTLTQKFAIMTDIKFSVCNFSYRIKKRGKKCILSSISCFATLIKMQNLLNET